MNKYYAAHVKDKDTLCKSSSGGLFIPLSDVVFGAWKSAVICSVYDYENDTLKYALIDYNNEDGNTHQRYRNKAVGTKYMQSDVNDVFKQALSLANCDPNKKIIFFGTGCQSEAFRKFTSVNHIIKQVYIVDIVCHGVPSQVLWRDYLLWLRTNNNIKGVSSINFKDKRLGWSNPSAVLVSNDNQEYSLKDYMALYYNHCCLRPSCHKCPYTSVDRNTDITIGDCWGIEKNIPEFYNPDGNSLMITVRPSNYNCTLWNS